MTCFNATCCVERKDKAKPSTRNLKNFNYFTVLCYYMLQGNLQVKKLALIAGNDLITRLFVNKQKAISLIIDTNFLSKKDNTNSFSQLRKSYVASFSSVTVFIQVSLSHQASRWTCSLEGSVFAFLAFRLVFWSFL